MNLFMTPSTLLIFQRLHLQLSIRHRSNIFPFRPNRSAGSAEQARRKLFGHNTDIEKKARHHEETETRPLKTPATTGLFHYQSLQQRNQKSKILNIREQAVTVKLRQARPKNRK